MQIRNGNSSTCFHSINGTINGKVISDVRSDTGGLPQECFIQNAVKNDLNET